MRFLASAFPASPSSRWALGLRSVRDADEWNLRGRRLALRPSVVVLSYMAVAGGAELGSAGSHHELGVGCLAKPSQAKPDLPGSGREDQIIDCKEPNGFVDDEASVLCVVYVSVSVPAGSHRSGACTGLTPRKVPWRLHPPQYHTLLLRHRVTPVTAASRARAAGQAEQASEGVFCSQPIFWVHGETATFRQLATCMVPGHGCRRLPTTTSY